MASVKVSPAEGRRTRDPHTMKVIEAGHTIDDTMPYWHRRIEKGDVTIDAKPGKAPKGEAATPPGDATTTDK